MKHRIILVLILMSVCVAGITGLQLYWNYQNYKVKVEAFKHDINNALSNAVDKEIEQRHQKIIDKFKTWLADTSFVQITCDNINRHKDTQFHMVDTHPYEKSEKSTSLGFMSFKQSLSKITPYAKKAFIDHLSNIILRDDLKKGIVYYYTQRLGDSLEVIFSQSKRSMPAISRLYQQELLAKGINAPFKLNAAGPDKQWPYFTNKVNTALRRPYQKQFVQAFFQSPDVYFLNESRWLILSSFLLIGITIFCFAYTVKTLFSQHKLALLKDDFINNMTHEINTPLSSITITAEALKKFDYDRQARDEYLDIITYQTEKLTALTERILNTSRLTKKLPLKNEQVELNTLINKAIDDMKVQINNTGAVINYNACETSVFTYGNKADLLNVMINIIDNALKYTDETPVIKITLRHHQHAAQLIFADQGIGIPVVYETKVFDTFFRVPKGNMHNVKGYGLGLSYVKEVINHCGGSIAVTANKPSGSIFTIQLPIN